MHQYYRGAANMQHTKPNPIHTFHSHLNSSNASWRKDMRRKIWSGAYLVFGTLLWTSAAAEDWPYTEASCNKEAHQLLVREKSAKREKDIPKRSGVQSLLALTKLKTINGPAGKQGHRVRKRDFWMECDLRESKYKVRISP